MEATLVTLADCNSQMNRPSTALLDEALYRETLRTLPRNGQREARRIADGENLAAIDESAGSTEADLHVLHGPTRSYEHLSAHREPVGLEVDRRPGVADRHDVSTRRLPPPDDRRLQFQWLALRPGPTLLRCRWIVAPNRRGGR